MNKKMTTGIIWIASGVILMAICGAIGNYYIQKERTAIGKKATKKIIKKQDSMKNELKEGQIGLDSQLQNLSKEINPEVAIYPTELEFLANQNIKQEFRITNQSNHPYFNIWVKFDIDSDDLELSKFAIELDPITKQEFKERVIKDKEVEINTYSYTIKGKDSNGLKVILTNLSFLDPKKTVGIILLNLSNQEKETTCNINASILEHSNNSGNLRIENPNSKQAGISFTPPINIAVEQVTMTLSR